VTRSVPTAPSGVMLLVLSLLAAACGGQASDPTRQGGSPTTTAQTKAAGGEGLTVEFRSDPDPPRPGDNTFEVTVTQPDGAPVTDAKVTAVFSMPAMPAMNMPAMQSDASLAHVGGGTYRGEGQLSMDGTWNVVVSVARGAGPPATARFSIVAQ